MTAAKEAEIREWFTRFAKRDKAQEYAVELLGALKERDEKLGLAQRQIAELEADCAAKGKALERYGKHVLNCHRGVMGRPGEVICTCGLDAALQPNHGKALLDQHEGGHVESITCPVLISAEALRKLLAVETYGDFQCAEAELATLRQQKEAAEAELKRIGDDREYLSRTNVANEWEERFQSLRQRAEAAEAKVEAVKEREGSLRERMKEALEIRCSGCGQPEGSQHRPSCARQGIVTPASDYRMCAPTDL